MYSLKDYIFSMKEVLSFTEEKVLILNPDGKVIYANDHFLTSSGYNRKDKSALNLNSLVSTGVKKSIDSALSNNLICVSTEKFNFSNSSEKISFIAFNIWNVNFKVGKVLILLDPEKNGELLKNNLFEESILRAMNSRNDAVWFMTNIQTGRYAFTSDSVRTILGWQPIHFNLGGWLFLFSIVHPDDITKLFASHNEWVIMKNKLGALYDHVEYTNTFRIKNSKGEYVSVDTDSNVLERDEEGRIKLIFGSFRLIDQNLMNQKISEQKAGNIKVIDGKTYVELDYLKKLREELEENSPKQAFKNLSSRELEILDLIVEEHSSVEISKKLNISIHTINLHRKQIMKKLEAKNLAGLIRIYYTSK